MQHQQQEQRGNRGSRGSISNGSRGQQQQMQKQLQQEQRRKGFRRGLIGGVAHERPHRQTSASFAARFFIFLSTSSGREIIMTLICLENFLVDTGGSSID